MARSPRRAPRCRPPADARQASPTAPRASSSPILRALLPRAPTRRRPACWWSAATGRAWRRSPARSRFFAPDIEVLEFPAWDCLPYDRVSPHAGVVAQRMTDAVAARAPQGPRPAVGPAHHRQRRAAARAGARAWSPSSRSRPRPATCSRWTASPAGSSSTASCAPRPCASPANTPCAAASSTSSRRAWPSRCGSISSATRWNRSAASIRRRQRTTDQLRALDLVPVAEFQLTTETIRRFRPAMSRRSARRRRDDLLYEAVSEGRRHPGMEHWLPLFHDRLDTLFDYLPGAPVVLEPLAEDAAHERLAQIADYYEARQAGAGAARRRHRPTSRCRRTGSISPKPNGASGSSDRRLARLTPFAVPDGQAAGHRRRRAGRAAISPPSAPSPAATCSRR